MADGTVGVLQAGSPDRLIDNEVIGSAYRQRVRLGGLTLAALADVLNSAPAGTEYALLTRPIPSGTQTVAGTVTANPAQPATGTVTNFVAAATNATLKASNASRKGLLIYNNSTAATMYLKFAATATLADFSTKIPPGGYYELPQPVYTGIVDCIWDIASGSAQVTEMS